MYLPTVYLAMEVETEMAVVRVELVAEEVFVIVKMKMKEKSGESL